MQLEKAQPPHPGQDSATLGVIRQEHEGAHGSRLAAGIATAQQPHERPDQAEAIDGLNLLQAQRGYAADERGGC